MCIRDRRIGIGRRYEEWFITDYDCPEAAIGKVLGAYESLSELNYLCLLYTSRCV